MTVNPIIPSKSNQSSQISSTQTQDGEQAFHDMTKSDGYNKGALEQAVSERTRLSRNKRVDKASKKKYSSLFLVSNNDDELSEEPIYRTVMVDGILFTLRLLAVA